MPFTPYFKSFSHTKAQIRVATLGDKLLTNLCAALGQGYSCYTIYEFAFPEIETTLGRRRYVGDVYFQVLDSTDIHTCHIHKEYHMCVELDGKVNHNSKYALSKDRVRDFALHEKLDCEVVRFSTWDISGHKWKAMKRKRGKKIDTKALDDIEILTEMNMVKFMKLPIPDSAHWREILHKSMHNACINEM